MTEDARRFYTEGDKEAGDMIKKRKLPAFAPAAIMYGGKGRENLISLTGICFFDIDHLSDVEMKDVEQIIKEDLRLLEKFENELDKIDKDVEKDNNPDMDRVNDIRGFLRDFRVHYDHLIDLAQELEENENDFFKEENIRFFRLFSNRVSRLLDIVNSLLDYTSQIRDTYESRLDVKQNRIMTVLTVVTTIFMPLTLIVGWYGMNFKYMPELDKVWGYPAVIIVSVLIVIGSLIFFKFKKWL